MPPSKTSSVPSGSSTEHAPTALRAATGYMPIEDYGLIGNMRTCALVATDGGLDFMCWPEFDSPSIFCRMLDKDKGGYFSISPKQGLNLTTKQQYLPSSNILQTRFYHEDGVLNLVDFFPRPNSSSEPTLGNLSLSKGTRAGVAPIRSTLRRWLVRRVECIRGTIDFNVELFPAFNYAMDEHTTEILSPSKGIIEGEFRQRVIFASKNLCLELDATIDCGESPEDECPALVFHKSSEHSSLGEGITAQIRLKEGQAVSFVLRDHPENAEESTEHITTSLLDNLQSETAKYWFNWISRSRYRGRWREVVNRSLLILKLLTYEPTGAIIAAPTFSLPEDFGGVRNWDYRFSWVRDSSFTIYILLRMGFTDEAEAYMNFVSDRFRYSRLENGDLPIMFSIRGETDLSEIELDHLEGYRGSKPVRIGNGAASHVQLDIYGELMDGIYLYNKYGKPVSYDQWVAVRDLTDHVTKIWKHEDMSIWEVRGRKQNFVYSKIMLWVAVDRALRLADKRCFPCPKRLEWLQAGAYDKKYLIQAITIFENMLSFANHLSMFSEEIARSGEQLGNTPQAFSHLALISAAFNLDRVTMGSGGS